MFDSSEPAVDVSQQNLWRVRDCCLDVTRTARTICEQRGTSERLLTIRRHDGRSGNAASHGIADPLTMLLDELRASFGIAPGLPWCGFYEQVDARPSNAQQAETKQPAKLAHAPVVFPPSAAF